MSYPVGSKFFPDGMAVQLGLVPIQEVEVITPPEEDGLTDYIIRARRMKRRG